MLIRGAIQDRLWGKTLGALGRRAVTGQLSIRSGSDSYAIVFDGGHVVAASAPGTSVLGLALVQELLDVSQVAELERREDRDQQLAALLPADQLLRLRRQTIAAAATRTFALTTGDFVFDSEVSLPVVANTAMHVGGIIYHGVTTQLDDERLAGALRELGTTFRSRADGIPDLQYFGFSEAELIVVRALTDGISMQQIEHLPPTERRIASAVIYTLASLGALYCESPAVAPRMARGTADPTPPGPVIARTASGGIPRPAGPRVSQISIPTHQPRLQPRGTQPLHTPAPQVSSAGDANPAPAHYRRGQAALRDERLDDAIAAFTLAAELSPDSHDYRCALAWARFCKAQDKSRIADATRAVLSQAVLRSENPVSAYYYLGMVERMLGRTTQAMTAFQQVLDLDPNHREAGTELRFLSRNSGPIKR